MKIRAIVFLWIVLVGCGAPQAEAPLDSETASLLNVNLRVECLKNIDAHDAVVMERLTLVVLGKSVKLTNVRFVKNGSGSFSSSEVITGTNNTIYDGAVVKRTHARLLLTPAEHVKDAQRQGYATRLRYALIEYSQGRITVKGADTQVILRSENCRTTSS